MMNRRALVAALAATPLTAAADPAKSLLDRAIARAGGAAALGRVRRLRWTGDATVFDAARTLELGVSTEIAPFRSAEGESWLKAQGQSSARTMIITPDGGWVARGGSRSPLPERQVLHERAQYALYGLMLLVTAKDQGADYELDPAFPRTLRVRHPAAPETRFAFDADGRLAEGWNIVPAPDTAGNVPQHFTFDGEVRSHGVRWPRRLSIRQGGAPYFDLRLASFEALA